MTRIYDTWTEADREWKLRITPMHWQELPGPGHEYEREAFHRAGRVTARMRQLPDYRWSVEIRNY